MNTPLQNDNNTHMYKQNDKLNKLKNTTLSSPIVQRNK